MGDIWRVAIGAGLQDAFNPCIFMTCAVFIVHGIQVSQRYSHLERLRWLFVLTYILSLSFFNFGPMEVFLFKKTFVWTAKIIYFVLGTGSFILGVMFLKDWFVMRRNPKPREDLTAPQTNAFNSVIVLCLITVILGVALSALATLWPINYYITLLGAGAFVNGQWQAVISLLVGYTIISMWPLWFLWVFLSIKNLRPALLKIVCASVFFVASSNVILIFK